jgi:alpha-tubulin suppressor-like RCC1 family protein
MISCGCYHNMILNMENELFACGLNMYGQLGLGDEENRSNYTKIENNFGKIKNIYSGGHHNIILNMDNELFVCGYNYSGQLGLGNNLSRNTFVKLNHNFGIIKNVYCGHDFNYILNMNNELFVCGSNKEGQLGLGGIRKIDKYVQLKHNFGLIKNIFCGGYYVIILNMDNELFVCGDNFYYQLGLGDKTNKNINEYVKLEHKFGIIKNICCGSHHNIILNMKNELFICGGNYCGQLGLGDIEDRHTFVKFKHNFGKIKNIFCGGRYSVILTMDNKLFVCGCNEYGQFGLGDDYDTYIYTFVKLEHNFGKIKNIYFTLTSSIVLNEKNELFVCGGNTDGQLGLGDENDRNTFVKLNQKILGYISNNIININTDDIIEL